MTAYALLRRIAKTVKPIQGICQGVFPIVELALRCRIPDDCIDSKRYPLFIARSVLKELIESLQSPLGVKPC